MTEGPSTRLEYPLWLRTNTMGNVYVRCAEDRVTRPAGRSPPTARERVQPENYLVDAPVVLDHGKPYLQGPANSTRRATDNVSVTAR